MIEIEQIIKITIPGKPIHKKRPRKDATGNIYDSQKREKTITQRIIKSQLPSNFKTIPHGQPVIINCTFFIEPAKKEQTKKFLKLIENEDYYYAKKPDRDNLDKWVLDALNGLILFDDGQVCDGRLPKFYSMNPRTEVEIIILKDRKK